VMVYALSVVVLLLAAALISYPLVFQRLEPYRGERPEGRDFSERDALLEALAELELSFHGGKLSQADYQHQRARLETQYIRAADAVEALDHEPSDTPPSGPAHHA